MKIQELYREIDINNDAISVLNKKNVHVYQKIKALKAQVEVNNSHFIGKTAKVNSYDKHGNLHEILRRVICTKVICKDDESLIFKFNTKEDVRDFGFAKTKIEKEAPTLWS